MSLKNNPCMISEIDQEQNETSQWSNLCTCHDPRISYVRDQMVHPQIEGITEYDTSIEPNSNQEVSYRSGYIREKMVQWLELC